MATKAEKCPKMWFAVTIPTSQQIRTSDSSERNCFHGTLPSEPPRWQPTISHSFEHQTALTGREQLCFLHLVSSCGGQGSAGSLRACLTPNKPLLLTNPLTQTITLGEQPAGSLLNFSGKHPPGFFNPLSGILGNGKRSSQNTHLFLSSMAYVSAFPSHTSIYHSCSLPVLPLQFPGESQWIYEGTKSPWALIHTPAEGIHLSAITSTHSATALQQCSLC